MPKGSSNYSPELFSISRLLISYSTKARTLFHLYEFTKLPPSNKKFIPRRFKNTMHTRKNTWNYEHQQKHINFKWNNSGIKGNEMTGQAAKQAITTKTIVKKNLTNLWQQEWQQRPNNKVRNINDSINKWKNIPHNKKEQLYLLKYYRLYDVNT